MKSETVLHSWAAPIRAINPNIDADLEKIGKIIFNERKQNVIFPESQNIFRIFREINFYDIKVLWLGQDPYYTTTSTSDGKSLPMATGVAFGIPHDSMVKPPSLKNIIKEMESDLDTLLVSYDYTLQSWMDQNIALLNTALTVREGNPNSHVHLWNKFTIDVIKAINEFNKGTIFVLLGNNAKKYAKYIDGEFSNHIITEAHPSPLSAYRGFFGSKIFSKINSILNMQGKTEIKWY